MHIGRARPVADSGLAVRMSLFTVESVTPAIGAEIRGLDFSSGVAQARHEEIYLPLLEHLVIFIRGVDITPQEHLDIAREFGDLVEPHPLYPHVEGYENIVLLENDEDSPPDTNSWHTDLTFKAQQPFASILIARQVPASGGSTL